MRGVGEGLSVAMVTGPEWVWERGWRGEGNTSRFWPTVRVTSLPGPFE